MTNLANPWTTIAFIGAASIWPAFGCGETPGTPATATVCGGSTAHIDAAQINVTRSTNSPDVSVIVYCDGSAERTVGAESTNSAAEVLPKVYEAGSADVLAFLHDLDAVGDVSAIPASQAPTYRPDACPKSASFGTVTTVTASGKTSGDLQCLLEPTAAQTALASDARVLAPWP